MERFGEEGWIGYWVVERRWWRKWSRVLRGPWDLGGWLHHPSRSLALPTCAPGAIGGSSMSATEESGHHGLGTFVPRQSEGVDEDHITDRGISLAYGSAQSFFHPTSGSGSSSSVSEHFVIRERVVLFRPMCSMSLTISGLLLRHQWNIILA